MTTANTLRIVKALATARALLRRGIMEVDHGEKIDEITRRLSPHRTHKAGSAESILKHVLRRRGWTAEYRRDELTDAQRMELLDDVRQYAREWMRHEAEVLFRVHGREKRGQATQAISAGRTAETATVVRGSDAGSASATPAGSRGDASRGRVAGCQDLDGALERTAAHPGGLHQEIVTDGSQSTTTCTEPPAGRLDRSDVSQAGPVAATAAHDVPRGAGHVGTRMCLVSDWDRVDRGDETDVGGQSQGSDGDSVGVSDGEAEGEGEIDAEVSPDGIIRGVSAIVLDGVHDGSALGNLGWPLGDGIDQTLSRTLAQALSYHVRRFFDRAKLFVKEAIIAGAMVLGGPAPLTAHDLAEADRQAHVQAEYLDRFERDTHFRTPAEIAEGETAVEPMSAAQFVARAELYGANATWGGNINWDRQRRIRSGRFNQERRVHLRPIGDHHACETCKAESAKGWVPIGSLAPIGDSECLGINCDCIYQYRYVA